MKLKKFIASTNMETEVWFEVLATSKKSAIKKILNGDGTEVDWNREDHPTENYEINYIHEEKEKLKKVL